MKNSKVIHTRVSETLYDSISKTAEEKCVTVSDFIRDTFSRNLEVKNPLYATDLLFVFAYIEYNRSRCKDVCGYEVRHILDIINRHYPNLHIDLQKVFDEVILKLNKFLEKVNLFGINEDLKICFGDSLDAINFDYDAFYRCTNGKLPYR